MGSDSVVPNHDAVRGPLDACLEVAARLGKKLLLEYRLKDRQRSSMTHSDVVVEEIQQHI